MNDPVRRSACITRRTLGVTLASFAGFVTMPIWSRWMTQPGSTGLGDLASRGDAAPLKVLGTRVLAAHPFSHAELESRIGGRLAEIGYDAAIAEDRKTGALVAIDGWLVPETQALAGAWLASA